jgi:hypothetical protein
MLFDHQHLWPFIDPVMPGGKPAAVLPMLGGEIRVEGPRPRSQSLRVVISHCVMPACHVGGREVAGSSPVGSAIIINKTGGFGVIVKVTFFIFVHCTQNVSYILRIIKQQSRNLVACFC